MGLLGDMVVRIKGDTGQFVKSLQSSERQTKRFVNFIIGGAGIGGAILIFRKFGQIVGDLIKEYAKQEQAEAKLKSAIRATGKETLISVRALAQYASGLQNVTTYADEETLSAAAMLQQLANLDEKGLKAIIPRVQNFAAAMGIDLETAATLVGKTLGSTTNALGRYGVQVDMSGDKSQKLQSLIGQLDSKFAGMAETIGQTATGKLTILRNQFSELKEQLAKELIPTINAVATALLNILQGWSSLGAAKEILSPKGFQEAISNIGNANAAIEILNAEIARTETLLKTQGRYQGPERERLRQLKERLKMILDIIPLLEAQAKYEAGLVPPLKEQVYYMDWIDRLLFNYRNAQEAAAQATANARNEFDMLFRSLGADIPQAEINLSNLFDMEGRVFGKIPETAEKIKMTFQDIASTIGSSMISMMSSVSQIWGNYYDGLIQDQEALLENQDLTQEQRKKIEKEIKKMRREAAIKTRDFTIFESIIGGAMAIINGLQTKPFLPVGIAMGALAAVLAGVQIAAIASQPLPAAAKGTKLTRPTMFMGGEAGPEWVLPELKLEELGGKIAEALQSASITNVINNNQPIRLGIYLDGRQIDAHITKSIGNRKIIVAKESVA